jgi:hypothetical protein
MALENPPRRLATHTSASPALAVDAPVGEPGLRRPSFKVSKSKTILFLPTMTALRTSRSIPLYVSILGVADCLYRQATELSCPVSTEYSMTDTRQVNDDVISTSIAQVTP